MTAAQTVWLVARREITAKLHDKGFIFSTLFIVAVILGSVVFQVVLQGGSNSYAVGVVGDSAELEPALEAQADAMDAELTLTSYPDADAARAAIGNDDVEAVIDGDRVYVDSGLDGQLESLLNGAVAGISAQQRLAEAGIDPVEVSRALDVAPLDVVALDQDAERTGQRQIVAFIGVVTLYGLLVFFGQYVAMGVVEEKSSRVVELLLAAIKPWQLLAGKLIGLGLLGLGQLLIICVVGLGAAIGFDVLAVPGDALGTIAQVIFWFVLGYAFYAAAFATGAALVSRQEDLQSVLMPMILLLVAGFIIAIQTAQSPDGTLARLASILPPLSPMVMPLRAAGGGVPWWETALAVVLMLAAIVAMVALGGRVYAGALLRTGGKTKIKEALANARS